MPTTSPNVTANADVEIKIDTTALTAAQLQDVVEVIVQSDLSMPEMCTFTLREPDADLATVTYIDDARFKLGAAIEIGLTKAPLTTTQAATKVVVFKGEITAIEPYYEAGGYRALRIRAYDFSHRLFRGRISETFLDQKDSDIVQKVVQAVGKVQVEVQATTTKHKYVLRANQTAMEFIQMLAARNGYQIIFDMGKLHFVGSDKDLGGPETKLVYLETLRSFQIRATGVQQANAGEVHGWDPDKMEAVVGKVTTPTFKTTTGVDWPGGKASKTAYNGDSKIVVTDSSVRTVDEAKSYATSLLDRVNSEYIQAEGESVGDPTLKAGKRVKLEKLGSKFSGTYYLTSVTHVWHLGKYATYFSINGNHPRTITHLVGAHETGSQLAPAGRIYGVVTALVTNLDDKDKQGRFKVAFKWMGDQIESNWVRPAAAYAGKNYGSSFLPEINDEVLIAFESGNVDRPYMIGALWNSKNTLPDKAGALVKDGKVNVRIIQSTVGHYIAMVDEKGKEAIMIVDKTGKNGIWINSKDNEITIKAESKITLETPGEIIFKATKDLKAEGKEISLDAKGSFKASAMQNIDFKATSNLTLKGTAGAELSNGTGAKLALSGPSVNINNGALEVM